MVGYPNVGKSSVINVLLGVTSSTHTKQRVAVGATPGKTVNICQEQLEFVRIVRQASPVFMDNQNVTNAWQESLPTKLWMQQLVYLAVQENMVNRYIYEKCKS